jgi:DinB superfamily
MRYLGLAPMAQDALLADLEAMPDYLAAAFAGLSAADAAVPGPDGALAPVEQCWHLADLEREGYGLRIQRLLGEVDPVLADFDGARIARERAYRSRSLAEGLTAFRQARGRNLARLRTLTAGEWPRTGIQEGVGPIALCDVPAMMAEHDAGHRQEITAWLRAREAR